jgi:hypothetical protein
MLGHVVVIIPKVHKWDISPFSPGFQNFVEGSEAKQKKIDPDPTRREHFIREKFEWR